MRRTRLLSCALVLATASSAFGLAATPALADTPKPPAAAQSSTHQDRVGDLVPLRTGSAVLTQDLLQRAVSADVSVGEGLTTFVQGDEPTKKALTWSIPLDARSAPIRLGDDRCLEAHADGSVTVEDCDGSSEQEFARHRVGFGYGLRSETVRIDGQPAWLGVDAAGAVRLVAERAASVLHAVADYAPSFKLDSWVSGIDVASRSAHFTGKAIPGAEVVVGGKKADRTPGSWDFSITVDDLQFGDRVNELTFEYQLDGETLGTEYAVATLIDAAVVANPGFVVDEPAKPAAVDGTATPKVDVRILDEHDQEVGSGTADADGAYSAEIAAPNAGGEHRYRVEQVAAGVVTPKSKELTVDYGRAVSIDDVSAAKRGTARAGSFTVSGKGEPRGVVTVLDGSDEVGTTTVDDDGRWRTTVTASAASSITVRQLSKGANTTTAANSADDTFDHADDLVTGSAVLRFQDEQQSFSFDAGQVAAGEPLRWTNGAAPASWTIPAEGKEGHVFLGEELCLAVTADGKLVAAPCADDASQRFTVERTDGSPIHTALRHVGTGDGRWVTFGNTHLELGAAPRAAFLYMDGYDPAFEALQHKFVYTPAQREVAVFGSALGGTTVRVNGHETEASSLDSWGVTLDDLHFDEDGNDVHVEYVRNGQVIGTDDLKVAFEIVEPTAAPDFVEDVHEDAKLEGVVTPGLTVEVQDADGKVVGTATAGADGEYEVDITAPNAPGEHEYTIVQSAEGETAPKTGKVSVDYGAGLTIGR